LNTTSNAYRLPITLWVIAYSIGASTLSSVSGAATAQHSVADYCQQARNALEEGRVFEGYEAARHALEIDPRSAEAECLLGMADLALGNLDAAGKDLKKALVLKPDLMAAHKALAALYLRQKRLKDAREQYHFTLTSNPNDFQSLYGLGLASLMDHQPELAISQFNKALKINARDPALLASLLQAQLQSKQQGAAVETLTKLDGELQKNDPRRIELAAMLVGEGAYDLASQQFERLRESQPESYELDYNFALAYHRAG
jgi:tetratricopeptide (TPR) repeat protein